MKEVLFWWGYLWALVGFGIGYATKELVARMRAEIYKYLLRKYNSD